MSLQFCGMSYRQLFLVAATSIGTHWDETRLNKVMSFFCCLVQSTIAQLSYTFWKTASFLLSPHRARRLLSVITETFLEPSAGSIVIQLYRTRSAKTSWTRQALPLFAVLYKAVA